MPPVDVDVGGAALIVSQGAHSDHWCVVIDDGSVRCWGRGTRGALGSGSVAHVGAGPNEMPPPPVVIY